MSTRILSPTSIFHPKGAMLGKAAVFLDLTTFALTVSDPRCSAQKYW